MSRTVLLLNINDDLQPIEKAVQNSTLSSGSIATAILASLCCIGPAAAAIIGAGSLGVFSAFEAYRPYLIGLTAILLGFAFYFAYRKREVKCEDGSCKIEDASKWNKFGVWGASLLAAFAIAFPYLGIASSPLQLGSNASSIDLNAEVSFFEVPLVCNAAPDIGCGSKAKFILNDLMQDEAVNEAWMNRAGTVIAAVWNPASSLNMRRKAVDSVFKHHEIPIVLADETVHSDLASSFATRTNWYKGSEVDKLSIEEAGVIADKIITPLAKAVSFRSEQDKLALREDVKNIIQNCFLSLRSFQELDAQTYQRLENDIRLAGENYLGKGKMPELRFAAAGCDTSSSNASCCANKSN
jgi:hypothetical protein